MTGTLTDGILGILTDPHLRRTVFFLILAIHYLYTNSIGGSSVIWGLPLVISDSEGDMPGIKPWPLGWYTSALTTGLHTRSEAITIALL